MNTFRIIFRLSAFWLASAALGTNSVRQIFGFVAILTAFCLPALRADEGPKKPNNQLEIAGTESLLGIKYLPDWRYSGDPSLRRDYELTLNLYLPPKATGTRFPLVIYVHGGAYVHGSKDEEYPRRLFEILTKNGIAVASLNYILMDKGIFPQVVWDIADATRFLRINADRYNLDPTAFGAMGTSAGGWLITMAGHADGETYYNCFNTGVHFQELRPPNYTDPVVRVGEESFLRPLLDPNPAHPGVYGLFQAMAFDFSQMNQMANGFTPALLEFTGAEAPHKNAAIFAKRGIDWTLAVMTDPKYHGGGVHVPALTTDADHGETSLTKTLDGTGTVQLADVIRDWFKRELTGPQARTPVPEIDPGMRLVTGPTEVSLVVPSQSITVRYTTDGSEPTDKSPVYSRPFTVQPGTHVRAFATMAGRRPSRVSEAFFRTGPVPPAVTAPVALELPPATAGKPYSVQFTANTPNARWCVEGELRPRPSESKSNGTMIVYYPNGMLMDGKGRWSGTPTTPGVYWMQVWANVGVGRIAGYRNYRWTVTGSPVGPQKPEEVLLGDTYKPLATLTGLNKDAIRELQDFFQGEGIRAAFQDAANSKVLLLVPAADSNNARRILAGKAVGKEWIPETEPATLSLK